MESTFSSSRARQKQQPCLNRVYFSNIYKLRTPFPQNSSTTVRLIARRQYLFPFLMSSHTSYLEHLNTYIQRIRPNVGNRITSEMETFMFQLTSLPGYWWMGFLSIEIPMVFKWMLSLHMSEEWIISRKSVALPICSFRTPRYRTDVEWCFWMISVTFGNMTFHVRLILESSIALTDSARHRQCMLFDMLVQGTLRLKGRVETLVADPFRCKWNAAGWLFSRALACTWLFWFKSTL